MNIAMHKNFEANYGGTNPSVLHELNDLKERVHQLEVALKPFADAYDTLYDNKPSADVFLNTYEGEAPIDVEDPTPDILTEPEDDYDSGYNTGYEVGFDTGCLKARQFLEGFAGTSLAHRLGKKHALVPWQALVRAKALLESKHA